MRSSLPAALLASAVLAGGPAPAHAHWSEEPPKLCTFKLDDPSAVRLRLLDAFHDAAVDPSAGLRHYLSSPWGTWRAQPWWTLNWLPSEPTAPAAPAPRSDGLFDTASDAGFGFEGAQSGPKLLSLPPSWLAPSFTTPVIRTPAAIFASNGLDGLWSLPPAKPVPNWRCRRRPVRMARYGGESDAFLLVLCDGSAAPEAFERLTLMVREAAAPRPGDLLPDEPDPEAVARGEWTPGVRLVHPRLLWVLQRIADAFPWRTLYIFSGYRHDPSGAPPKPGTHHSMHSEARAVDVYVMGIPNTALFQACRKLEDVGCGFYPNNKFVHVDVRAPGSGHPFWIDVSEPGEPSRYVDAWPGVVDGGGLVWDPAGRHTGEGRPGAEAACTTRSTSPR